MNQTKQLFISLIMILLIIGISGCGAATEDESSEAVFDENTVVIKDYKYQPAEITIKTGETVTWINKDSVRHNATDDTFDTGLLGKDKSAQQQFDEAGTYDYYCTPHPYMKGTVIVE